MHLRRTAGVTLLELMIAMFIALLTSAAVFSLFLGQSRAMRQSQETVEIHDNVRVALDMMGRDLRSSGFMVPSQAVSLRVENDCGNSPNASGVTAPGIESLTGGGGLKYPPGTANSVDVNGDVLGTVIEDGCPNGSDRLSTFFRPRVDYVVANAFSNTGNTAKINWDCPIISPSVVPDCTQPFIRGGITGTTCGLTGVKSDPVLLCASADPFRCYEVTVEPQGGQCDCTDTSCEIQIEYNGVNFNVSPGWDALCPPPATHCAPVAAKTNSGFDAWATRTYQLLDLDGDGSTELVVSDNQNSYLVRPTAAAGTNLAPPTESVHYDVVANYIDDLQVAVAYRNAPDTFLNVNLWNFGNCVESGSNHCLLTRTTAPANPPIALRVTIVARSAKRRKSETGTVDLGGRPAIEDNAPPLDPYNPLASITPGGAVCYPGQTCGCGGVTLNNLMGCSTNGNAQGYGRRVITEIIGIRNMTRLP